MDYKTAYMQHKKLWEEAEADNKKAQSILINLWEKGNHDPEIEDYFRSLGGIYLNGKFCFYS